MKTLQSITLGVFVSLLFSCKNEASSHEEFQAGSATAGQYESSYVSSEGVAPVKKTTDPGRKTYRVKDPKTGIVMTTQQYPADWEVVIKPYYTFDDKTPLVRYYIKGPNGINLFNNNPKPYFSVPDTPTGQMLKQYGTGLEFRRLAPVSQVVKREIVPRMQREGFSYASRMVMEDVKRYTQGKIREGGVNNARTECIGTIWKNAKGEKAMAIITHVAMPQPLSPQEMAHVWIYNIDYIFANAEVFENTVEEYKKSVFTSRDNPEWKQLLAQRRAEAKRKEAEAMQRSAWDHQNRMRNREAAFQAHQAKIRGINQAMDASHNNFMSNLRSTSTSAGIGSSSDHNRFINMIREEETVYRSDGQQYQVESGYDDYYIDDYGNTINSNDPFFDAENNIYLEDTGWEKVEKQDGY